MKKSRRSKKNEDVRPCLRSRLGIKSFRVELTLTIFVFMLLTSAFTVLVYRLLRVCFPDMHKFTAIASVSAPIIACTVIGAVVATVFTKWVLSPLSEMISATERISKGDFKVHIQETFDEKSDFGRLQRSFNHMAQELDSIELFRNDFINNFSHEFKTPIVSIQGFARQLQAGGLSPVEEREYIRIIAMESDRLAKMATNILLLSKLENQVIVTDKTEFYLDEQIRTSLVVLEKQWSAKNIDLNLDLDEVKYCFNETMLSHIWLNLFGNAIKFTPEGGTVSCTLRADKQQVTACISDTGIGMDEPTRRHIFEKFYQGDTSHAGDGNGIGLTIVGRILVLCGGHIEVESQPNQGSRFTVTLPVTVPTYEVVDEYEK